MGEKYANLIDDVLDNANAMSADSVIQAVANIHSKGTRYINRSKIDRDVWLAYPQFIQDIIWILDLSSELGLDGTEFIAVFPERYVDKMIAALCHISANKEAETLIRIYQLYQSDSRPDYAKINELADRLCFDSDSDIWLLLETYVETEKGRK